MKDKVKVKKYNINWQGRKYEILIPYFPKDSLWIGVLESEDGNGILGTWEGLNALSVAFELASRNPYSIIYIPIKDFLIPDVEDLYRQVTYCKNSLLDIVIASTKTLLKRSDWKNIRNKINRSPYKDIAIKYHFEDYQDLELYKIYEMTKSAITDLRANTFFNIYPQEYLKSCSSEIYGWLNIINKEENYSLAYNGRSFTFYKFYSNKWDFFCKHEIKNRLYRGFYLDCWDIKVMENLLGRNINMISFKEAKQLSMS